MTLLVALKGMDALAAEGRGMSGDPRGASAGPRFVEWGRFSLLAVVLGTALAALGGCGSGPSTHGAAASAHLYWSDISSKSIGRANLDGSGANHSLIPTKGIPTALAVNATHVYWASQVTHCQGDFCSASTGTVGRANIDGSGVNQSFITAKGIPGGVAVDGAHIYWSDSSGTIGRANIDGSGVNQSFISGASDPKGVAVDRTHVYWANNSTSQTTRNTIGRANLDGSGVKQSFINIKGFPHAVAVGGTHVYWSEKSGAIGRASKDGSGVNQSFIPTKGTPIGLAVDASHIYWDSTGLPEVTGPVAPGTIGRANLNGSAVNQNFISGISSGDVAVETPLRSIK